MKSFFNSVLVAFSMFSKIPMPQKRIFWDANGMKYMMAAFPLVGVLIGIAIFAWTRLAGWLGLPSVLTSLGLTIIPVGLTGGIHLDGFADTSDALAAKVEPEKRREILKDPRAGAFALISVTVYLLSYFGLTFAFDLAMPNVILLCIGHVFSRALSGLSVISLQSAGDGTVKMFHDSAAKRSIGILIPLILICILAAFYLTGGFGRGMILWGLWIIAAAACHVSLRYIARHKFGGMSGDLAGWFLQVCEIWQLAVIVVCSNWRFS